MHNIEFHTYPGKTRAVPASVLKRGHGTRAKGCVPFFLLGQVACFYTKLPKLSNEPPRWFTPQEIDMLVNAAAQGQYKAFFRLAGYSGMRCSEPAGLFQTKFGTHLKAGDINRIVLKPLCVKLGILSGTTHSFRHGRISLMVASRLPDKFVRSQVGQVNQKITNHYTHFADQENHEMVNEVLLRGQNSKLWSTVN